MQSVQWKRSSIERSLWPNDVDVLAVVDNLADERHVLERKHNKSLCLDVVAKDRLGLHVESTLSKNSANQTTSLQVRLDLLQNVSLGMRRRRNENYVGIRDDILCICRDLADLSF